MPEFILKDKESRSFQSLDSFTQGYIEAMFFTDCHPDTPELEDKGFYDLSPEALDTCIDDCTVFQGDNAYLYMRASDEQAGHDFWFTRNGHGVGFWARPEIYGANSSEILTEKCRKFKELSLYLGDDGKIYID